MDSFKSIGARAGLVVTGAVALAVLTVSGAFAAPGDDPTADAIATFQTRVTTYGTAIVAVVVVAMGFWLGIKYLKKAQSKV